jgi:hypothetical protein
MLLAGPVTPCAPCQALVELVQQSQTALGVSACSPREEAGLGIKLRQRHSSRQGQAGLAYGCGLWDNPPMTVTTDAKKRVVLPGAKPGDSFDVKIIGEEFRLTRLKMPLMQDTVRLVKRHGYTLAAGTRPITQEQVRSAMDEFP